MDATKLKYITVAWLLIQVVSQLVILFWFVMHPAASPQAWLENFAYILSEESGLKPVFAWSCVIIVGAVVAIFGYLKGWADGREGKWLLFILVLASALPAVFWLNWHSAMPFVAAPLFAFLLARFGKPV